MKLRRPRTSDKIHSKHVNGRQASDSRGSRRWSDREWQKVDRRHGSSRRAKASGGTPAQTPSCSLGDPFVLGPCTLSYRPPQIPQPVVSCIAGTNVQKEPHIRILQDKQVRPLDCTVLELHCPGTADTDWSSLLSVVFQRVSHSDASRSAPSWRGNSDTSSLVCAMSCDHDSPVTTRKSVRDAIAELRKLAASTDTRHNVSVA